MTSLSDPHFRFAFELGTSLVVDGIYEFVTNPYWFPVNAEDNSFTNTVRQNADHQTAVVIEIVLLWKVFDELT